MRAWPVPPISEEPLRRLGRAPELSLYDARSGRVAATDPGAEARLYVCGITPYDATHLGHAATYVAFDLAVRAWREAGHQVRYVQNVTDVDDPLLERARATGEDWVALAERETQLYRDDMTALSVIPPDVFAGAVESIPVILQLIRELQDVGAVYAVDGDLYYSVTADPQFGQVSGLARDEMVELFRERGGDPERPGKQDPLDCIVWMLQREGEPGWESEFGAGRPGWHVECAAIARTHLGLAFDVQGGGTDLVFPHHEMSAGEVQVVHPGTPFAKGYAHQGMVGLGGHKMSKSRGNLVLVSRLRADGVDPRTIRLVLLTHHYRNDWEWTDDQLAVATKRLDQWLDAIERGGPDAAETARAVRAAMADDLDAPRAVELIDAWADADGPPHEGAGELMAAVVEASLGISCRRYDA
jgi:L-cysteine:1D-myo-inositol 2-amino-2-deoxy-alpha-D-glucopyranoside ligase